MRPAYRGSAKRRDPNPIVLGRKFCPRCGRWRYVVDFGVAPNGKVRVYCTVCQNRSNAASAARVMADPARRERHLEYQRIWHEAKRRANGVPVRAYNDSPTNKKRRRRVVDRVEFLFLDAAPLVRELDKREGEFVTLARKSKVSERSITRIRHENRFVRIDVADKLAHAMGIPLETIYNGAVAIHDIWHVDE